MKMDERLNTERLRMLNAPFCLLCTGEYALPVRFRIHGPHVECRVPTWSGVGDRLPEKPEVTLVAVAEPGPNLRWLFIRGQATLVPDPDWQGLEPTDRTGIAPEDLYQILRIRPRRIELIDEQRGWGYRETADL